MAAVAGRLRWSGGKMLQLLLISVVKIHNFFFAMTLEQITSGQSRSVNSSLQLLFGGEKRVNKNPNTVAVVQSALKDAPSKEGNQSFSR